MGLFDVAPTGTHGRKRRPDGRSRTELWRGFEGSCVTRGVLTAWVERCDREDWAVHLILLAWLMIRERFDLFLREKVVPRCDVERED